MRMFLVQVLPKVADLHKANGGTIILRPDSGDPVEQVVKALKAAEKTFGAAKNGKGYKMINNAGVIQGDGINYHTLKKILEAVHEAGYSAQNVAFGMGGALLQKMNRDTMSFATKLSHIVYANGEERDVMKTPKSSSAKTSLPGRLFVGRERPDSAPVVLPLGDPACRGMEPVLKVVYNKRPVPGAFDDFDRVKERLKTEWAFTPPNGNAMSPQLQAKIDNILKSRGHKTT
mmetsp:Transcript_12174/g.19097  ORF Transcript_12174/g.19097 Transcript_12174/m.19097 type:complete len:231 (-) Transcript_12174:1945-2637(-)